MKISVVYICWVNNMNPHVPSKSSSCILVAFPSALIKSMTFFLFFLGERTNLKTGTSLLWLLDTALKNIVRQGRESKCVWCVDSWFWRQRENKTKSDFHWGGLWRLPIKQILEHSDDADQIPGHSHKQERDGPSSAQEELRDKRQEA